MDVRYRIDELTLSRVPELRCTDTRAMGLMGTLGGGVVAWQGGLRAGIALEGAGLTEAERTALIALLSAGTVVEFDDGVGVRDVVVTAFEAEPLIGTALYRYRLTLVVVPAVE